MSNAKRPYLIDLPVQINIWIRPDCQRKQFEIIKKVSPNILFLVSDGGRNEKEWELINENRNMFDNEIDWDCTVYKIYSNTNHGLYSTAKNMYKFVWEHVDRCVFFEDDDIPSETYFRFAAELLDKYQNDLRINGICGNNPLIEFGNPNEDYLFSRKPSIQGMALWKRSMVNNNIDCTLIDDYSKNQIIKNAIKDKKSGQAHHLESVFSTGVDRNHIPFREFFNVFNVYAENQVFIIPTKTLIINVGYGENAAHSGDYKEMPYTVRKYFFNDKLFDLQFPLRHPKFITINTDFDDKIKYLQGNGYPLVRAMRNIEKLLLAIRYGDWSRITDKLQRITHKQKEN